MHLGFLVILGFWITAAVTVICILDPLLAYALGVAGGIVIGVLGVAFIALGLYRRIKRITWRSK